MELLQAVHGYQFFGAWAKLTPTPYALVTLVLFVWSIFPAIRGAVHSSFTAGLRVTWFFTLLPAVTGILLALNGLKVPSATAAAGGLTKYGFEPDPSRNWEHWMYSLFALMSLYVLEILVRGKLIDHRVGLRFLPVVTLFLYGVAYMIGRVAVLPGSTPGT